jgi:putative DNA primase/helicase
LFNSAGMREALSGFDFKRALDHIQEAGVLIDCGRNERSRPERIGKRNVRVYSIDTKLLGVGDGT